MISPDCPVSALCFPRTPHLEETTFICGTTAKLSSPQCLEKGELLRSPRDHKEIEMPKGFSEDLPCPYKVLTYLQQQFGCFTGRRGYGSPMVSRWLPTLRLCHLEELLPSLGLNLSSLK